ncbi:MAG: peptidoglycan DD-metalloendopeptidase family protein [Propionicimonas sp.]|uniref:M23 family metallopeptidase n=1 Tax=Propionicimonas sp. TaxID=1955623 RepID=UPI002B201E66|nr:peptidoglycan DD-metalloendopeptidase family protein [Propionicimonas sp.]MEA4944194.1 peptidoglycan DD-metalloendopeptidase family protein [Propionicimonas sp.]MEA5053556.1 peptidoglycan DD-metalloendopeptidase family protein [Propionicimonas sp.]
MALQKTRADKARRALVGDPAETAADPRRIVSTSRPSWWRRGLAAVAVSGIGIGSLVSLSASGSFADVAFAGQREAAAPAVATSQQAEPAPVTVEELAQQRQTWMAKTSRSVAASQQQAFLEQRQEHLTDAAASVEAEADRLRNLENFLWPTEGNVGSPWGRRYHPILHYYRLHNGADIGGKCGQPIYAAQTGTVIKAAMGGYNGGSGNNVRIDHGDINGHNIQTGYLHMSKIAVKVGQKLNKGDLVGYVGNTGLSTACHLHLSLYKDGRGIDPMEYVHKDKASGSKKEAKGDESTSDSEDLPADSNQKPSVE